MSKNKHEEPEEEDAHDFFTSQLNAGLNDMAECSDEETLQVMAECIKTAHKEIRLKYNHPSICGQLQTHLKAALKRGVKVRVLVDQEPVSNTAAAFFRELYNLGDFDLKVFPAFEDVDELRFLASQKLLVDDLGAYWVHKIVKKEISLTGARAKGHPTMENVFATGVRMFDSLWDYAHPYTESPRRTPAISHEDCPGEVIEDGLGTYPREATSTASAASCEAGDSQTWNEACDTPPGK